MNVLKFGIAGYGKMGKIRERTIANNEYTKLVAIYEINDYKFLSQLYSMFPKDDVIDLLDAYQILRENPQLVNINNMVNQIDLDEDVKTRISKFYEQNKDRIIELKKNIYAE